MYMINKFLRHVLLELFLNRYKLKRLSKYSLINGREWFHQTVTKFNGLVSKS